MVSRGPSAPQNPVSRAVLVPCIPGKSEGERGCPDLYGNSSLSQRIMGWSGWKVT